MEFTVINQPQHTEIMLSGQFTFTGSKQFKQIMELVENSRLKSLTLNFRDVSFIDSAGLGMLLLVRDLCQKQSIAITLDAIRGQVEKVFSISKFDHLFTINH